MPMSSYTSNGKSLSAVYIPINPSFRKILALKFWNPTKILLINEDSR